MSGKSAESYYSLADQEVLIRIENTIREEHKNGRSKRKQLTAGVEVKALVADAIRPTEKWVLE